MGRVAALSMVLLFLSQGIQAAECLAIREPNEPSPADRARDVPLAAQLSWKILLDSGCGGFRIVASTGSLGVNVNPFSLVELKTDPVQEVRLASIGFLPSLDVAPTGVLYGASITHLDIIGSDGKVQRVCGSIRTAAGKDLWLNGIAFHPDGTLYAVSDDPGGDVLYTINPSTCIATAKCPISSDNGSVWGIDFAPNGTLYGAFSSLVKIDMVSGSTSLLGSRFGLPSSITDIDWAPDGFLYGVDDTTKMLYQIDPANGSVVARYGPYGSEIWGVASQCLNGLSTAAGVQAANLSLAGVSGDALILGPGEEILHAAKRRLALDAERMFMKARAAQGFSAVAVEQQARLPSGSAPGQTLRAAAAPDGSGLSCAVYLDTVNPPVKLLCQNIAWPAYEDTWLCEAGSLEPGTVYYWKVVARTDCGVARTGGVWSFRTEGPLLKDTFAATTLDPAKWAVVAGATVDEEGLNEPSAPYSLRLNASSSGGDGVETGVIDLSGYAQVTLSYSYQQGGGGDDPEEGDDLIIEWYRASRWREVKRHLGQDPAMTRFQSVTCELPSAALTAEFKLRFRCKGTSSGSGSPTQDDWFIDDIILSSN
jgi:hypothetical protein